MFVSFGNRCFSSAQGRGPPVWIVHGTVYHNSGFLFPQDSDPAKYAQVYLYDPSHTLRTRFNIHRGEVSNGILHPLQKMSDRVNPYVGCYRSMHENLRDPEAEIQEMRIAASTAENPHRYNNPRVLEPAVVFVSGDGVPPTNRDIAVWPRDPNYDVYRISDDCEHIDPLAYPLLFPRGEPGWQPNLFHAASDELQLTSASLPSSSMHTS